MTFILFWFSAFSVFIWPKIKVHQVCCREATRTRTTTNHVSTPSSPYLVSLHPCWRFHLCSFRFHLCTSGRQWTVQSVMPSPAAKAAAREHLTVTSGVHTFRQACIFTTLIIQEKPKNTPGLTPPPSPPLAGSCGRRLAAAVRRRHWIGGGGRLASTGRLRRWIQLKL